MANPLNFDAAEAALVSHLISNVTELTADNTKAHDYDAVYNYALANMATTHIFAWTDFAGGDNQGRGIWAHRATFTLGILFISGADELDNDIRTLLTEVQAALLPSTALSGAVSSARIESISSPESWIAQESNIPHVEITFSIVMEQMMTIGSLR